MDEKRRKAEALLDAIGEIDDSYLQEAISYKKRRRVKLSRLLIIAATVILAVVIPFSALVGTSVVGLALIGGFGANQGQAGDSSPEADGEAYMEDRLSFLMLGMSDSGNFKFCQSEEEIPYADGNAYLVWQIDGESGYYMSDPLDYSDVRTLTSTMGRGERVEAGSPTIQCKVWLLLEDGRVISPYLRVSAGNISNSVFDYEAEITPDDALVDRISDILN